MEMGTQIATRIVAAALGPFSGHDAIISLLPLSVLLAMGMLWVFRRTSNPEAIGKAKARAAAHLYEMRLFADEPVLIWKAQWDLLKANARYIGLMLVPAIVMTIPMVFLFSELECFYGLRPLEPGKEAILTVQLKTASAGAAPQVRTPDGIAVETDGVRLDGGRQISWRLRATRPTAGQLQIAFPGETVEKSVESGDGPRYLSDRRVSSLGDFIWHPAERLLPPGRVDWIEVRYPDASVQVLGLDLPWLAWMLLVSMISALALKRRFRVTF
jgi:hypothetical protein